MSAITDSEDAVLVLSTSIRPDWAQGVTNELKYTTAITTSHSGIDQRSSRRVTARKVMEFTVDGLSRAQSQEIFSVLENRGRGALIVPWWAEGLRLSVTMSAGTSCQVEVFPLADWLDIGDRILIGTDIRIVTGITGRVLTLQALGGAILWPAGTWAYPMRLAVMDRPEKAASIIRFDAARQELRFVQLDK
jgi:hypothetical protein